MTPSISVVIPTYNYGRFVCTAVKSVLAQTAPPQEIIVVDDGSTDDTAERLRAFGGSIRYVYQTNTGLSAARNTGIREAKRDWIAFLDSDDWWHPQKLERQIAALQQRPDLDCIGCARLLFTDTVPTTSPLTGAPVVQRLSLYDVVHGTNFGSGSGIMIRRTCFDKIGLFDEQLRAVEDLDMWLRVASCFSLGKVCEILSFQYAHQTSMSMQAVRMERNHRLVLNRAFAELSPLKHQFTWKRAAFARMHRTLAWMYYQSNDKRKAFLSLARSFLCWPFSSASNKPFIRLRLAIRILRG